MGHKAGPEFFEKKREWSKRKDEILRKYLPPYIQKVAHGLGRPICIVDGFAGPGMFKEGNPGSPAIIEGLARDARQRPGVEVCMLFVEQDPQLHAELAARFSQVPHVHVRRGAFLEHLQRVERYAETHSTFLYLDPYTVEGLEWEALDRVFRGVDEGRSIEVLLNFNAGSFWRRARAALGRADQAADQDSDDPDSDAFEPSSIAIRHLDAIVGGDWWQALLAGDEAFGVQVRSLVRGFCDRLHQRFRYVCHQEVLGRVGDRVPKYAMVFGSRSPEGLLLMNDAMASAREMFVRESESPQLSLFETRPESVVPDPNRLTELVLEHAHQRKKRQDVVAAVARARPGSWFCKEIKAEIRRLLKNRQLEFATGRIQINDETDIWRP